jgi:hypothetical protein
MAFVEKDDTSSIDLQFCKARIIGNNTLLVMIDTSIYTEYKEAKEYEKCMNVFLKSNQILSLEQITKEQNAFITGVIKKGITGGIQKVVLIGHHPLGQWKTKDDTPQFTTDIPKLFPVLLEAYTQPVEKTPVKTPVQFYYLCADYHSFQQGSLSLNQGKKNMVIKQYISGTGGTELDDDLDIEKIKQTNGVVTTSKKNQKGEEEEKYTFTSKSNDIAVEYTLEKNQHEWGYLVWDPTATDICDFVPVPKQSVGGRKSRKIKRRNRLSVKKRRKSHQKKTGIKATK